MSDHKNLLQFLFLLKPLFNQHYWFVLPDTNRSPCAPWLSTAHSPPPLPRPRSIGASLSLVLVPSPQVIGMTCAEGNLPRTMKSSLRVVAVDRMNLCLKCHFFLFLSNEFSHSFSTMDLYSKKLTCENYISKVLSLIR